jgi:hypothetical protein
MIADMYVPVPTFTEVKNQENALTLSYSHPMFNVTYVKTSAYYALITVTGLTPQHEYDMYTYVVNLNQINNPAYTKLSFSTVGKKKV